MDITTADNEDLVIAPGSGGNVQIGIGSGTNSNATGQNDLHITGILESSGASYLDSNVTLGGSSANTLITHARLASNLLPATTSSYTIGSLTRSFSGLYVGNIGDFITVDAAQARVGLGTTSPQARLDIRATGTSASFALRISDTAAAGRLVILDNGNLGIGTTAPQGLLQAGSGPAPYLLVTSAGNVGIGTSAPAYKLQVMGSFDAAAITISGSAITTTPAGLSGEVQYNNAGVFGGASNLYYDGTNVGVGTTAPAYKMQVAGSFDAQAITINGSPITTSTAFNTITSGTNTTAQMIVGTGANINYADSGSINAKTLATKTWEAPADIGAGTAAGGSFTSLYSTSLTSGSGSFATLTGNLTAGTVTAGIVSSGTVTATTGSFTAIFNSSLSASKPVFTDANKQLVSPGVIPADQGGTGQSTYSAGDVLIALDSATLNKGRIFGTTNQITVTTASGSVTLSAPQDLNVGAVPAFAGAKFSGNVGIGATSPLGLLQVGTQPNPYLIVTTAGNVGVGTTAPAYKMQVAGSFDAQAITVNGSPISTSPAFSAITSGTNTSATMTVGAGATLDYVSTGAINAKTLAGATWAAPGAIGGTTAAGGSFTSLTAATVTGTTSGSFALETSPITIVSGTFTSENTTFLAATGGNVGIGTTAPLGTLHLSHSGSYLTPALFVNAAGDVGIGTTSPGYKLEVANGVRMFSVSSSGGVFSENIFTSDTDSTGNLVFGEGGDARIGYDGSNLVINPRVVGTGSTIFTSGNVGIGATSPLGLLQVGTQPNPYLLVTAEGNVGIGFTSPQALLQVGTAASSGLFVLSSGNVGVGTTAPAYKMQVAGSFDAQAITVNGSPISTSSAFNTITSGTNTTATMTVGAGAALDYVSTGAINAKTLAGATWAAPGAIGGTTAAGGSFTSLYSTSLISGSGSFATLTGNLTAGIVTSGTVTASTGSFTAIFSSSLSASKPVFTDANKQLVSPGVIPADQGGTGQSSYSAGDVLIGTSGGSLNKAAILGTANQITVTATSGSVTLSAPQDLNAGAIPQFAGAKFSGNVGIGTTSPISALHILSSGSGTGFTLRTQDTAGTDRLVILDNGNVGVGTTAPAARLQINNSTTFASAYANGNSGVAATVNWNNGNKQSITLTNSATIGFTAPSGASNLLLKITQDGTGGRTINWGTTVNWPSGTAPVLTTAGGAVDIITFYYDGTTFYGSPSYDFK